MRERGKGREEGGLERERGEIKKYRDRYRDRERERERDRDKGRERDPA